MDTLAAPRVRWFRKTTGIDRARSRARSPGVSANEATMIASALRRAGSVVKNSARSVWSRMRKINSSWSACRSRP